MIQIRPELCVGCGSCVDDCFPNALELSEGQAALAHEDWCIRCGHCIAVCPTAAVWDDEQNMDEVRELSPEVRQVDGQALLNLMQFRRATRHFCPDPVPEEVLAALLNAGRWCPTAVNRQGTSFIVVREQIAALKDLAVRRLGLLGQVMLMKGDTPDMLRRAEKFVVWSKRIKKEPDFDPLFFHAPLLVMTVSDERGRLDAVSAATYMELEAVAQGLGVLYSGYFAAAAQGNEEISAALGLAQGQELVRCLVLGWPDIQFRRVPPRDPADVRYL